MFTIKRAAELTGLPVATLRAWERRYRVVEPVRSDGGYRLYDEAALLRLTRMKTLVGKGWAPAQAAQAVLDPERPATRAPVVAATDLVAAAAAVDSDQAAVLVDDHFARLSFEAAVDDWLLPTMTAVGAAWSSGMVDVAGEHLVVEAVMRRLAIAYEAAGQPGFGPTVLLALPPGARHEVGLLAFATACRRQGIRTTYLGADLPLASWREALRAARPDAVATSVSVTPDLVHLRELLATAESAPGGPVPVAVGGGLQDQAPAECRRLGHAIGPAARLLASLLRADSFTESASGMG